VLTRILYLLDGNHAKFGSRHLKLPAICTDLQAESAVGKPAGYASATWKVNKGHKSFEDRAKLSNESLTLLRSALRTCLGYSFFSGQAFKNIREQVI
jgi:hypothetical protein